MGGRTQGFTLPEAILVLGVVAAVLALLLPSLVRVRDVARSAVCQSNLRQVHTALETYRLEVNRGVYPVGKPRVDGQSFDPIRDYRPAMAILAQHLGVPLPDPSSRPARSAFVCPADRLAAIWIGPSYEYDPDSYFVLPGAAPWLWQSSMPLDLQARQFTRHADAKPGEVFVLSELDIRAHKSIAPTAPAQYGYQRVRASGAIEWGAIWDGYAPATSESPLERWAREHAGSP